MKLPIIMRDGTSDAPSVPLWYEVASNGVFMHRTNALFESCTPSKGEAAVGLQKQETYCTWRAEPLPAELLEYVVAFFRRVNDLVGSEAIVVLFYNPETKQYLVDAPLQFVKCTASWTAGSNKRFKGSDLHVDYINDCERPEGFIRAGTIHSHCDVSAHFSHTDHGDEVSQDGLHGVMGHIDDDVIDINFQIVAGGERFTIPQERVIEEFDHHPDVEVPEAWLDKCRLQFRGKTWHVDRKLTDHIPLLEA